MEEQVTYGFTMLPSRKESIVGGDPDNPIKNKMDSLTIDLTEEILPPQAVITVMEDNGEEMIFGTMGNFSVISGKAKSRKTYLLSALTASANSSERVMEKFKGNLPAGRKEILYFDTEQSKYHVHKVASRINDMSNGVNNVSTFMIKELSTKKRLEGIDYVIANSVDNGLGLVIIDGIRDLMFDINDTTESTSLTDYLMKWVTIYDIHIIVVLHENKTDGNVRGHIGTEVLNKAETVISVTKADYNNDISNVKVIVSRNIEFSEFSFSISEDQPVATTNPASDISGNARRITPESLSSEEYDRMVENIFDTNTAYGSNNIAEKVKYYLSRLGHNIGFNKAKEFVLYMEASSRIVNTSDSRIKNYVQVTLNNV